MRSDSIWPHVIFVSVYMIVDTSMSTFSFFIHVTFWNTSIVHSTLKMSLCTSVFAKSSFPSTALLFAFSSIASAFHPTLMNASLRRPKTVDGVHVPTATAQLSSRARTTRILRGTWTSHTNTVDRPEEGHFGYAPTNTCPFTVEKKQMRLDPRNSPPRSDTVSLGGCAWINSSMWETRVQDWHDLAMSVLCDVDSLLLPSTWETPSKLACLRNHHTVRAAWPQCCRDASARGLLFFRWDRCHTHVSILNGLIFLPRWVTLECLTTHLSRSYNFPV